MIRTYAIRAWALVWLLALTAGYAAADERWCSDEGVCVDVPEGHEVRIVPSDMPENCVGVTGFKTKKVEPDTCEPELVVSPSLPCEQ